MKNIGRGLKAGFQKGFTLIELIIVVVILGVLAIVVASQFGGGVSGGAKSQALYQAANKLASNWTLVNQSAGTSTVITSNANYDTGKNALDILIGGKTYVLAAYKPAYDNSGVKPLTDIAQGTAGGGAYTVLNYAVTLTGGGGSTPLSIAFAAVPDEIVLPLVQKYGSGVSSLAASDATNAVIQYGTVTAGARDITILKQL